MSNQINLKQSKPQRYGKYLAAGIIAAGLIFAVFKAFEKNETPVPHKWSRQIDSAFVMNCVSKYRNDFGQDTIKRTQTIEFCLCMLGKIKLKYEEDEMDKVTNEEIKNWDNLCRGELMNPNR
ncbi:MAG: hypothetical protein IPG02_09315 [Ignavibacteria bacterium]|nr:hypothetical protein [Ignavibacteria bacterium]MBK6875233.1 hypothetical protein [Ignavibacteria bacterium]MBK9228196.1 hypothetical protein [Ignavibacteria bacterium]